MKTTTNQGLSEILANAIVAAGFEVSGPADIRAAEQGEPIWVCQARAVIAELSTQDDSRKMTGLMVSLNDGESWQSSGGCRAMFHDAAEGDDGMADLLVNVTTEGVILDLVDQTTGQALRTMALPTEQLVELTV